MMQALRFAFVFGAVAGLLVSTSACAPGAAEPLKAVDKASFAAPPETITLKIKGYRPQTGKTYQHLFVSNFSVKAARGQLLPSTARDGMSDALKVSLSKDFGFTLGSPESAVTGFLDLLIFNMGVKIPQQTLLRCASNQMTSTSNDALTYNDGRMPSNPMAFLGLRDCEKVYLGLNPSLFDNSGSGMPDYLKLRCGLSPQNKTDAYISTAGDGIANIDKCKRNIPIDESAFTQPNQLFAYRYSMEAKSDGSTEFTVANIPVLDGGDKNFIAIYVVEAGSSGVAPALYSAFTILKPASAGQTIEIPYWATSPATYLNQEIVLQ